MIEFIAAAGLVVISPVIWAIAADAEDETGAPYETAEGAAWAVKPPRE
jgi:hypothetical protein